MPVGVALVYAGNEVQSLPWLRNPAARYRPLQALLRVTGAAEPGVDALYAPEPSGVRCHGAPVYVAMEGEAAGESARADGVPDPALLGAASDDTRRVIIKRHTYMVRAATLRVVARQVGVWERMHR